MRLLILGSTGMLGNAVAKHFQNYNPTLTFRNEIVSFGSNKVRFDPLVDSLDIVKGFDFVINCIGTIKPFMVSSPRDSRYINSVFPWDLSRCCNENNAKLIHITTDCVFSGSNGRYTEESLHDAIDDYGKSKSLGEPTDCMVIRTSIIGEEIHKNASLIEWAKSQKGKTINGFTNHYWNGITTKEYAKCCEKIITNNMWGQGLFHIFSKDIVSKFQMLNYFDERFNLNISVNQHVSGTACDRSLSTVKELNAILEIKTVYDQIMELPL